MKTLMMLCVSVICYNASAGIKSDPPAKRPKAPKEENENASVIKGHPTLLGGGAGGMVIRCSKPHNVNCAYIIKKTAFDQNEDCPLITPVPVPENNFFEDGKVYVGRYNKEKVMTYTEVRKAETDCSEEGSVLLSIEPEIDFYIEP